MRKLDKEREKQLLKLNWRDFTTYPLSGQMVMVHAEGYDTKRRKRLHQFFAVKFNALDFPSREIQEALSMYHAKWYWGWVPLEEANS